MSRAAVAVVLVLAGLAGAAILLTRGGPTEEEAVDPPAVDSLLRKDTVATVAREADLDGDGIPEVVLASRSQLFTHFEFPPQYLDVFAYRDGSWRRIFDATLQAPAGEEGPERMLDTPAVETINRLVDSVDVVDFEGDGAAELVVGIQTIGAGQGPLELWVVSLGPDGGLRSDFYARTTRGGEIRVDGDRVIFEFPVYRPADPGCCPSRYERQSIGLDEETGSVEVLERTRGKVAQP